VASGLELQFVANGPSAYETLTTWGYNATISMLIVSWQIACGNHGLRFCQPNRHEKRAPSIQAGVRQSSCGIRPVND